MTKAVVPKCPLIGELTVVAYVNVIIVMITVFRKLSLRIVIMIIFSMLGSEKFASTIEIVSVLPSQAWSDQLTSNPTIHLFKISDQPCSSHQSLLVIHCITIRSDLKLLYMITSLTHACISYYMESLLIWGCTGGMGDALLK